MMNYLLPALLIMLMSVALLRGIPAFDVFVQGARSAFPLILTVLPYMGAMMLALNVFRASGALDGIISLLSPLFRFIGIPAELTPLIALRPFSGSAAIALLNDVYVNYGTDSYIGLLASVMLGSTETIFYTVALYFGSVGIKKTRHAIPVALLSGVFGIIVSVFFVQLFY